MGNAPSVQGQTTETQKGKPNQSEGYKFGDFARGAARTTVNAASTTANATVNAASTAANATASAVNNYEFGDISKGAATTAGKTARVVCAATGRVVGNTGELLC